MAAVVMRTFFSDGVKQQPNYGKKSLGGADTHTIFSNIKWSKLQENRAHCFVGK